MSQLIRNRIVTTDRTRRRSRCIAPYQPQYNWLTGVRLRVDVPSRKRVPPRQHPRPISLP
eukprot:16325764-Heterocapsa_arctica.AAC.1